MKKYKMGLIIGRFQPLHKGHIYLVKEGQKIAGQLIIAIGSANVSDFDNPYSINQRIQTLADTFKDELDRGQIQKIIPLDDNASDDVWLTQLRKSAGNFDVVIGNNERVQGIMERAGCPVVPVSFYKRKVYEGKKIREKLRQKNLL